MSGWTTMTTMINMKHIIKEQIEMTINSIIIKLFKVLNEEKKKVKTRKELLEVIKGYLPYFNIPEKFAIYILELYVSNYRKDGDYSSLTKDNFIDPRDMKGKVTSNTKSDQYTKALLPFRGSNLEASWKSYNGNKYYLVKSWGWYPIYIYRDGIWYETVDRYSSSTGRQMYRSQPYEYNNTLNSKVYLLTRDEMNMVIDGDSHEKIMQSKRDKLKKIEPTLKSKRLSTFRTQTWRDDNIDENLNIKFKINSVEEEGNKSVVTVDIYDVVKRVNGVGVPTPENYLKGEIPNIDSTKVENVLKRRLNRDFEQYIGPKFGEKDAMNVEFKFNHLKK